MNVPTEAKPRNSPAPNIDAVNFVSECKGVPYSQKLSPRYHMYDFYRSLSCQTFTLDKRNETTKKLTLERYPLRAKRKAKKKKKPLVRFLYSLITLLSPKALQQGGYNVEKSQVQAIKVLEVVRHRRWTSPRGLRFSHGYKISVGQPHFYNYTLG